MSPDEIQKKLSSTEVDVLLFCNEFIDELLAEDRARGQRAEDKAQSVLNACGIGASIIAGIIALFYQNPPSVPIILVLLFAGALIILLIKSVYFSLKTVEPSKAYQANDDLVFDVQKDKYIEAIREAVAVKIWLYRENVAFNSSKLFYLHRAIRNLAAFICYILIISFIVIVIKMANAVLQSSVFYVIATVSFLVPLLLDFVAEERDGLWKKLQPTGVEDT